MSRADQFSPLPADTAERWSRFGNWDRDYYPNVVGITVEEVRTDYCRMRLVYRPEIEQPAGVVHGGAIASLVDSVVVPAIGMAYAGDARFSTIDMHVQYLSALIRDDAVAEGWVVRRGRTIVFCEAEVVGATSGKVIAKGILTYHVSQAPPASSTFG